MNTVDEVLRRTRVITFDCYGTLIDWAAGLRGSLDAVFGEALTQHHAELFEAYTQVEAVVEAEPYHSYREVLAATVERLAQRLDLELPPGRARLLAESLPEWRPFPDTNAALRRLKERYRLGVLSNIDRDLFVGTARHFDVEFDFVVTAEDVQSYKPGHGHFRKLLEDHAEPKTVLHVAQSLYHDGVPAAELGLAYVWINRYRGENDTTARPVAEYPDLKSLADAACGE